MRSLPPPPFVALLPATGLPYASVYPGDRAGGALGFSKSLRVQGAASAAFDRPRRRALTVLYLSERRDEWDVSSDGPRNLGGYLRRGRPEDSVLSTGTTGTDRRFAPETSTSGRQ